MKLSDLNKQIDAAEKTNAEQVSSLKKERFDFLLSQTVTIGELLNRHKAANRGSTQRWSSPNYYIIEYAKEIILKRENKNE